MIKLVFIRHGATKGNLEKRYIGRTDEPLCSEGKKQALLLKKLGFPGEYIFVSPMKRAIETAELIFPGKRYVTVENFKETDFGIFEGKSAAGLSENPEYLSWVNSGCTLPVPGGESITEFKKRCVDAFRGTLKNIPDGGEASYVLHGGVIMALTEALDGGKGSFYDCQIKNGEYIFRQSADKLGLPRVHL